MAPPLCRTPLEMESRKMFPWCDLDILRALWRSTMFPCRRQCRRQESGKVGIPVSNHNPQLLFGPHPAQSQSTQRLPYSDPDRFQLLFATHFVSLWFQERENRENAWVSWKQLEATQKCQKPGLGPIISSTCLPEHEVVRAEQLAERSGTNAIHGACNNIWQSEAIKTTTHKPQSLFRIWLPRMLADFTPMRHQFHSIPTSNMCECSAESQRPMSAEMYLLKTSWIMLQRWQWSMHLARGPSEQHVAHSGHLLPRWSKRWCAPCSNAVHKSKSQTSWIPVESVEKKNCGNNALTSF